MLLAALQTNESGARAKYTIIHNPNSLTVIEACQEYLPGTAQYLCFDTVFHATLLPETVTYALPPTLAQSYNLRRYGAHGLAYQYVVGQAACFLGKPLEELRRLPRGRGRLTCCCCSA